MTGKRTALLLILSAAFGYVIHDAVSTGVIKLLNRTQIVSDNNNTSSVLGQASVDQFMVKITYTGFKFEPNYISMRPGNYLIVTNRSKTELMWLDSNLPGLRTTRGYAEGEQFQYMIQSSGTFLIKDKLNPSAEATLHVQ